MAVSCYWLRRDEEDVRMSRRIGALLLGLLVCAATLGRPTPAAADDDNLAYIIPAAVGGAVALVAIIAIVMVDRTEPEYELVEWRVRRDQPAPGVHLAHECALGPQGRPLLCW